MDLGQVEVIVDVEYVDGSQVPDPVLERQQVRVVDGHLKLCVGAEDLHLQQNPQTVINQLTNLHTGPLITLYDTFRDSPTPEPQR